MEMFNIQNGERFENELPPEAFSINLVNGMPMIAFNFDLSDADVKCFLNGDVSFGLFNRGTMLFLLFKIGGFMEWSDLAFTIHLSNETIEIHESYLPFNLVLVESKSKIVRGLRVVTVSPDFRNKLATIIGEQRQVPFNTIEYYKQIGKLYNQYPNATDMLKEAVVVETGGKTFK